MFMRSALKGLWDRNNMTTLDDWIFAVSLSMFSSFGTLALIDKVYNLRIVFQ